MKEFIRLKAKTTEKRGQEYPGDAKSFHENTLKKMLFRRVEISFSDVQNKRAVFLILTFSVYSCWPCKVFSPC